MENTHWFHCTTHTYGAWLYGDERGYRTRHHREHVEGDYKNPPAPGTYDKQRARNLALIKQPPVIIPPELRPVIGQSMVAKLIEVESLLLCLSVSGQHVHLLAKMPDGPVPRKWVGMAKRNAFYAVKERNWTGELWAVRGKVNPVKDRKHQLNTYQYILRHADEGAWIWDFRDPNRTPK